MTDLTKEQLEDELTKAYRALRGIYGYCARGKPVDHSTVAYHVLTLAAAARFVHEGALDGSTYFIGKHVDVLQAAMSEYGK